MLMVNGFAQAGGEAREFFVSSEASDGDGSFRKILQTACDSPEDEVISFIPLQHGENGFHILLQDPLVIPADCRGSITIHGYEHNDIIFDGSQIAGGGVHPGDSCTLNVYSDQITLQNFSFIGNPTGAGVCLFSRNNILKDNRFGKTLTGEDNPNKYGIVVSDAFQRQFPHMDGSGNEITANSISSSTDDGIWVHANNLEFSKNTVSGSGGAGIKVYGNEHLFSANTIQDNAEDGLFLSGDDAKITANEISGNGINGIWIRSQNSEITKNSIHHNGGCPTQNEHLASDQGNCLDQDNDGGYGILVADPSFHLTIGGQVPKNKNTIQYNRSGGIVVLGDAHTSQIFMAHNVLSKNYGAGLGIDLGGNGVSPNDAGDADDGPNHLLNFIDNVRVISMGRGPDGLDRYSIWGTSDLGSSLEAYTVDSEDLDRGLTHGGTDVFVADVGIGNHAFQINPSSKFTTGDFVTFLVHDDDGNTSEFSTNVEIVPDEDGDGIADENESEDGIQSVDTDGDGLPDDVEDKNLNGRCEHDLGETCADDPDTDGDGLSDFLETRGDGIYDRNTDTNPLVADTDGDGIPDGREDTNHNGIWEASTGETSPRLADSDGDHRPDAQDNCKSLFNPGQEAWLCAR